MKELNNTLNTFYQLLTILFKTISLTKTAILY